MHPTRSAESGCPTAGRSQYRSRSYAQPERRGPMRRTCVRLGAGVVLAGCNGEVIDPLTPVAPVLESPAVTTRPDNVLSALVTGRARFADSVTVQYGTLDAPRDSVTP